MHKYVFIYIHIYVFIYEHIYIQLFKYWYTIINIFKIIWDVSQKTHQNIGQDWYLNEVENIYVYMFIWVYMSQEIEYL
jgi:hypothetical protein